MKDGDGFFTRGNVLATTVPDGLKKTKNHTTLGRVVGALSKSVSRYFGSLNKHKEFLFFCLYPLSPPYLRLFL